MKGKILGSVIIPIFLILMILTTSCHQDYIYIVNDFGKNSVYNSSKDEIAFYKFIHIAKPPKSFGTSKTIFKKTALFTYNLKTKELKEIYHFEDLPSGRDTWIQGLSYTENILAFSVRPVNWKYYNDVKEKFSGIHFYYKDINKVKTFNSDGFNPVLSADENHILYFTKKSENSILWLSLLNHESNSGKIISDSLNHYSQIIWGDGFDVYIKEPKNKAWKKINLTTSKIIEEPDNVDINSKRIDQKEIKNLTKDITFQEWGIDINKYVPKSHKARIKDLVSGYGSESYRLAILEKIEENLDINEIEMILDDIGMYKADLSNYERMRYENSSKILEEKLKELLKSKTEQ